MNMLLSYLPFGRLAELSIIPNISIILGTCTIQQLQLSLMKNVGCFCLCDKYHTIVSNICTEFPPWHNGSFTRRVIPHGEFSCFETVVHTPQNSIPYFCPPFEGIWLWVHGNLLKHSTVLQCPMDCLSLSLVNVCINNSLMDSYTNLVVILVSIQYLMMAMLQFAPTLATLGKCHYKSTMLCSQMKLPLIVGWFSRFRITSILSCNLANAGSWILKLGIGKIIISVNLVVHQSHY